MFKKLFFMFLIGSMFLFASCSSNKTNSFSESEILELFEVWNNALITGDSANVTNLYAQDAILLPTVSNKIRTNHTEIDDYFQHFLKYTPEGKIDEYYVRIFDNIAINSGKYTFTLIQNNETVDVKARYTYVYKYDNNEWKIIEHHSSVLPE